MEKLYMVDILNVEDYLNNAATSSNSFTTDITDLGNMRVKLKKAQYRYTLIYVVVVLLRNNA
jgi:hypothetical protein